MELLLNQLLTLILQYGYPVVSIVIFLGYLGIPIPATALLLAAGSFTVTGDFNIYILISLITIISIAGDSTGYLLGQKLGQQLLSRFGHQLGINSMQILKLTSNLEKSGRWYIFISRWLVTPLGVPLNLIAGISGYPFRTFLTYVSLGELLWSSIYITLGHIFGASWQTLLNYIDGLTSILALFVVAIIILYSAYKLKQKN